MRLQQPWLKPPGLRRHAGRLISQVRKLRVLEDEGVATLAALLSVLSAPE